VTDTEPLSDTGLLVELARLTNAADTIEGARHVALCWACDMDNDATWTWCPEHPDYVSPPPHGELTAASLAIMQEAE
jgi:hypothetical protein